MSKKVMFYLLSLTMPYHMLHKQRPLKKAYENIENQTIRRNEMML